jgi:glucose-6-phosphate 1-dehydrogenase
MVDKIKNTRLLLVIFGASGDLAERKLIPALYDLKFQKLLPDHFAVLGVGRTPMSDEAFRDKMKSGIQKFLEKKEDILPDVIDGFLPALNYIAIDTSSKEDYQHLKARIFNINESYQTENNFLFYLSTPPSLYATIISNLGAYDLNNQEKGWKRIIIEKPFGYDLSSAIKLNHEIQNVFYEDQIYRIDHYLGKETVQNILVTRFANGIFEPIWNRNFIHHIEVTSSEAIGVENRGGYYDSSGAIRDMVQNHLLQLVGMIAMEPPANADARSIRNETLKVFQSLRPLSLDDIYHNVIRGQYKASRIKGLDIKGYREEANVIPCSKTETYLAMKFFIDNWRWSGVPFYLRTGKRLPIRVTEIVIHFHPSPLPLFTKENDNTPSTNQLIIRIQPDEGILFKFGMKVPGAGFKVQETGMDFHYSNLSENHLPSAYERLLLDCMLGDATLYIRGDAVEATWGFISPVLDAWKEHPDIKLFGYPAGTWGPDVADALIDGPVKAWRYPCKNLTSDDSYCEL